MNFQDKVYIEKYMQEKQKRNIFSGELFIGGNRYSFIRQPVPKLPISMFYPKDFIEMSSMSAKVKYPDENRPDVILTHPVDETVNFLYTKFGQGTTSENIPNVIIGIQAVMKRMNSSIIIRPSEQIETKIGSIEWFEYMSPALDEDIYNLMYTFCLEDELYIGGFTCLREYRKQWKPIVLQMVETIACVEENFDE